MSKKRAIRDAHGVAVIPGDVVSFSYGIPPVGVKAPIILRDGKLIALTEGHNPPECPLSQLKKHAGDFYIVSKLKGNEK